MIEYPIYDILQANAPIAALIGTRFRPSRAGQSDQGQAYITYKIIESDKERWLDAEPTHSRETIVLSVFAPTFGELRTLVVALDDLLDEYEGTVGDYVIDNLFVDTSDTLDEDIEGQEVPAYQCDMTLRSLWHRV